MTHCQSITMTSGHSKQASDPLYCPSYKRENHPPPSKKPHIYIHTITLASSQLHQNISTTKTTDIQYKKQQLSQTKFSIQQQRLFLQPFFIIKQQHASSMQFSNSDNNTDSKNVLFPVLFFPLIFPLQQDPSYLP